MDLSAFLLALYKHAGINYPKFYKMDNLSKLGFLAAEMILKNPTLILDFKKEDIAIVLYNRNSSLDTDINYFETVKEMASPALFVYTLPNILIGELCIRHGFKGENIFFLRDIQSGGDDGLCNFSSRKQSGKSLPLRLGRLFRRGLQSLPDVGREF